MILFIVQYVSILYLLWAGIIQLSLVIRCVIHDREYALSIYDFYSASSIFVLFVFGFPEMTGLIQLKLYLGF